MNGRKIFGLLVTALVLSSLSVACSAPPPEPAEREVTVEKEVPVTVEVEKQVTVTATPEPRPELATAIRVDSLSEDAGKKFEDIVVKPFAEEMGVEIEVSHGTYSQQEEWLANVRAAPGEYCIATYLSDFGIYSGVSQGLLQPFRLESMPNYANLDDRWEKRVIVAGDDNAYVATVDMGMYTFVYAKDKITEKPDSYDPLFDPQYAGRIALRDYALYRVFQTAAYLGLDPNDLSESDVDEVFETMAEQAELARAYWQSSSQLDELLANREVWIADYWFDTITRVGEDGTNRLGQLDIGWWFPEEGGPLWAGGPVIAAGCEDPERRTAELLFNYMLRPEVLVEYAKAYGFVPTLELDLYDSEAFFADAPYKAAYRDALLDTGIVLDVATVLEHQEEWYERYEEMKLNQ